MMVMMSLCGLSERCLGEEVLWGAMQPTISWIDAGADHCALPCHRGKSISDIGWFLIIMSVLLFFIGAGLLL